MTYVGDGMAPILIQHGRVDHIWCRSNSRCSSPRAIADRVGAERFELDLLTAPATIDPLFETEQNLERVFAFIERHLG